jgi:hypothetical protein
VDTPSGRPKLFRLLLAIVLATAAIIFALLVIWATRPSEEPKSKAVSSAQTPSETRPLSSAKNQPPPLANERAQPKRAAPEVSWEGKLHATLSGQEDNGNTVRRLLQGFNHLAPEAQTEYIAHALNLCEDADFGSVEGIYLQSGTPTEVSEQIFDDALNRPDELKLLLMARTMTTPNHPMQQHAREILCLYLDLDLDTAGAVDWSARTRQYLHENPAIE